MNSTLFSLLLVSSVLSYQAKAAVQNALITWTGNAGCHANILMTYDDSFPTVGAWGGGAPISGTPTNQGISQLYASFYTPSSLTPLFSVYDISNSVITYKFLGLNFNTATASLLGGFDIGKDSFAEGETNSPVGQYYLLGPNPALIDPSTGQAVDTGGQFTITVVPEPAAWTLVLLPAVALILAQRKR